MCHYSAEWFPGKISKLSLKNRCSSLDLYICPSSTYSLLRLFKLWKYVKILFIIFRSTVGTERKKASSINLLNLHHHVCYFCTILLAGSHGLTHPVQNWCLTRNDSPWWLTYVYWVTLSNTGCSHIQSHSVQNWWLTYTESPCPILVAHITTLRLHNGFNFLLVLRAAMYSMHVYYVYT